MFISYIIFFFFCSILFFISLAISKIKFYNISKKMKESVYEILIYDSMLDIEKEYVEFLNIEENKKFNKEYPCINKYLIDISKFLDNCEGIIDYKSIIIKEAKIIDKINNSSLENEIKHCPVELRSLICRKNNVIMDILTLKYSGLKYYIGINIYIAYLAFKIVLLTFISKTLKASNLITNIKEKLAFSKDEKIIFEFTQELDNFSC